MEIKDHDDLKVGDWIKLTSRVSDYSYVYCVKSIDNSRDCPVRIICPYRYPNGEYLKRHFCYEFIVEIMPQEEVTAHLLNGNPY